MRYLIIGLFSLSLCLNLSGCANSPGRSSVSDVDDEFDTDLADSDSGSSADSGGGNDDLDAELDAGDSGGGSGGGDELSDSELNEVAGEPAPAEPGADAAPPAVDKFAEAEPGADVPPPADENPAPPSTADNAPTPDAPPAAEGDPIEITNLEFKANEGGGTIVIQSTGKAAYQTRVNAENQQFVIEIMNARLPAKFKRPYNTKEFPGPIAGIQAYQNQGARTARIVVQLREPIEPVVKQAGNQLLISPSEENLPVADAETSVDQQAAEVDEVTPSALNNKNIESFLLGQSKFYGRKISIQFRDADIRDVFNFISEESGLNILLTDDVNGKITLKLRQVPWDQALIVIMKSKQLGYIRQGNVLRISGLSSLQKESDAARLVLESQAKLRPLRVKVFPVSYAKVSELESQAREFLSDRGKAKGDARTNSLIVNDLEENIERVGKLIDILDTETPQVLIEAKVVEARQDFQRRIGLSWTLNNGNFPLGQINGTPLSIKPTFAMPTLGTAPINTRLQIGTFDYFGDIDATLNLFESEGLVRVISAPRIVTLNGVKASIDQTTELPFKKIDTNAGGTTTSVQFKPITLKLDVSPQITADGSVVMQVQVTRQFPGADSGDGNFPVNSRQANTTLLVRNGQTTVLGGIYQSDVTEREDGIPFLRKLPVIGGLFRGRSYSKDKNELMIFMTPRILNKEKAFRQQAKEES